MINCITKGPLLVEAGPIRPSIDAPACQLMEIHELLDRYNISHWLADQSLSFPGEPDMGIVFLDRDVNTNVVQAILDSVP